MEDLCADQERRGLNSVEVGLKTLLLFSLLNWNALTSFWVGKFITSTQTCKPAQISAGSQPTSLVSPQQNRVADYTGVSKKMDGIWNRYNLKSTGRIYTFGILKCSEKFKALDLP